MLTEKEQIQRIKDNFEAIKQEWSRQESNIVKLIKGVNKHEQFRKKG